MHPVLGATGSRAPVGLPAPGSLGRAPLPAGDAGVPSWPRPIPGTQDGNGTRSDADRFGDPKLKRVVTWISVIGSAASVIALGVMYAPTQKESSRQDVTVDHSGVAGVSNGGNVSITVNPPRPETPTFRQPSPFPGESDYRDLANPQGGPQLIGRKVVFRSVFLGDWNLQAVYSQAGVPTGSRQFINHRSIYYAASTNGLGGSDSEIPPFPISVPMGDLAQVRSLRHGDFILVTGVVRDPGPGLTPGYRPDYARVYVEASEIRKLLSD